MTEMKLEGKVALVTGGGTDIGRSVALALSARGVRVVVTGPDERPLGETVGEIAYGGGKARHVVGDVAAAAERAIEVFGGLDIVVAADATFSRALPRLREDGSLVTITLADEGGAAAAHALADRPRIASNAVVVRSAARAIEPEEVAALVLFLCSESGSRIRGRSVAIG